MTGSRTTTVTFSQAGTYQFLVKALDADGLVSEPATVTVNTSGGGGNIAISVVPNNVAVGEQVGEVVSVDSGMYYVPPNRDGNTVTGVDIIPPLDYTNTFTRGADFDANVNSLSGGVNLVFTRPAPYLLRITERNSGNAVVMKYVEVLPGGERSSAIYINDVEHALRVSRVKKVSLPNEDLVLLAHPENDPTNPSNTRLYEAYKKLFTRAGIHFEEVTSVADAIQEILNYADSGANRFSVAIVDHGGQRFSTWRT